VRVLRALGELGRHALLPAEVKLMGTSGRFAAWLGGALVFCTAIGCFSPPELPEIAAVPGFALLDQDARVLERDQLRGHVWVANFMFTSCPDVCPLLTERMSGLRTQLVAERGKVRFVSFSVDPQHDTPAVLKKYANEHRADFADWRFVTGPIDRVKDMVVAGFKQTMEPLTPGDSRARTVLHGSHFVLIDDKLAIRGYYPTDPEGLKRLERDTRLLVRAQARKQG
jgi:protein SCO1/2